MENGKSISEIKVGTKLIAVDDCIMDNNQFAIIEGKEYEVITVGIDSFTVKAELPNGPLFEFSDANSRIFKIKEEPSTKPHQYNIGIDTFERSEANMTKEELLACVRFNIDKYNWRKKGQDEDDFRKIIDYANFAIKQLKQ